LWSFLKIGFCFRSCKSDVSCKDFSWFQHESQHQSTNQSLRAPSWHVFETWCAHFAQNGHWRDLSKVSQELWIAFYFNVPGVAAQQMWNGNLSTITWFAFKFDLSGALQIGGRVQLNEDNNLRAQLFLLYPSLCNDFRCMFHIPLYASHFWM
jgi:hypothetical protein